MLFKLILVFVLFPFIELAILVKLGTLVGLWYTLALCLSTGIVGASLARWQGLEVINKIKQNINSGRIPEQELFDGVCILVGGIVLLTPGLLSDAMGLLVLVPNTRKVFQIYLKRSLEKRMGIIDVS